MYMQTTLKRLRWHSKDGVTANGKLRNKKRKSHTIVMQYDLFEDWRDSNWYQQAGESMQKKANYLRLGIYNINQMLEDPTKTYPPFAIKDMRAEKNSMTAALRRIEDAYDDRCIKLKDAPELLRAFQKGFLGK